MNMQRIAWAAIIVTALFGTVPAAGALGFPERIALESQALQRVGSGTARYAGVIQVYDAALYAPPRAASADILGATIPLRLEIVYHRPIEAEMMIRAAQQTLERQHGAESLRRWQPQIERLHAAYRDVVAGDRFALTTAPGRGLGLEFNGRELVRIDDAGFAQVYFGIWLGEQPLSAGLRDALLPATCCQPTALD